MKQRLKSKIALVTGASSGIGEATAYALASEGVHLIMTARRKQRLDDLSAQLQKQYNIDVLPVVMDVCDRAQVDNVIQSLDDKWRAIDILINNAGLALATDSFQSGNIDNWDTMIDTNV